GRHQRGDVVVGDRHSLRVSGGARGVDDVGGVVVCRPGQRGGRLFGDRRIVEVDDLPDLTVQPRPQIRGGQGGSRGGVPQDELQPRGGQDRKSTRLNSSHVKISYAVFCLKK